MRIRASIKRLWQLLRSILGAALGVQSREVQERDFRSGSAWRYILGGLIFTLVFVALLIWAVNLIVQGSGAPP